MVTRITGIRLLCFLSIVVPSFTHGYSRKLLEKKPSVLFTGMHMSDSHLGSMQPTARSMHEHGFDVHHLETHIRPEGFKFGFPVNHTYIQLPDFSHFGDMFTRMWTEMLPAYLLPLIWISGETTLVQVCEHHNEKLAPVLEYPHDLVVADELFSPLSYGIAMKKLRDSNTPYIIYSTTVVSKYFKFLRGTGVDIFNRPAIIQEPWVRYDAANFNCRLKITIDELIGAVGIHVLTGFFLRQGVELLGVPEMTMPRVWENASYYYLDELSLFTYPSSIANNIIHTGMHCENHIGTNVAYEEFDEILNDPTSKGTIYIAFGTFVPWKLAPKHIVDAFVDAINQLTEYRIIFSFSGRDDQIREVKKHVMITRWAPQRHILNHNSTKLFISHGGLKSFKEGVCSDTPILFMPLFGEQPHNAEMAIHLGIGDVLDKTRMSGESMYAKMKNILENPSYTKKVKKVHSQMLDRPASSTFLSAFYARRAVIMGTKWLEYTQKMPYLWKFLYFDLSAVVLLGVLIISR